MKTCPRCELSKPDACFIPRTKKTNEPMKATSVCLNCIAHRTHGPTKKSPKILTKQTPRRQTLAHEKELIRLARREREAFARRGSPEIKRPYVFVAGNPDKGVVNKLFSGGVA